jgi:hypothetical protein
MKPVKFPDWVAHGRRPRWPDLVIGVLRIVIFVLLLLFC